MVKCGEVDHVLEGPAPLSISVAFVPQSILRNYVLHQAVPPMGTSRSFVLQMQNVALWLWSNLFRYNQVSLTEKMGLCAPNVAATSGPEPAAAVTYMDSEPLQPTHASAPVAERAAQSLQVILFLLLTLPSVVVQNLMKGS